MYYTVLKQQFLILHRYCQSAYVQYASIKAENRGGNRMLFIEYPKCSTCQRAKKWLEGNGIVFEDRHIVEDNPTAEELAQWYGRSGLPLKKFFNTSGMKYKELGLKDKLPEMSEKEQIALLATDGMLVKRPLIIADDIILTGFREKEWIDKLLDS